ncbi:MAG: EamA family transporter RarD [Desulfopila sp.]
MQYSHGIVAAIGAYLFWGILPIYWKALKSVSAMEIFCHRMVWSLFFTWLLILISRRLGSLASLCRDRKNLLLVGAASLFLACNWLLYIWAVNAGYVIETSLGYYINPLVSVLFGVLFLGERLRPGQIGALLVALGGVLYLTYYYGQFPWIAFSLAFCFGSYGLLHKKMTMPVLEELFVETAILFLPTALFLVVREAGGHGAFLHGSHWQTVLLIGTGLITSLPLLFFAYAAQRISLIHLGLLQYIAPTMNLLLGIFLYHEPFPRERMVGFMLVWSALVIYMAEGVLVRKRRVLAEKRALTDG